MSNKDPVELAKACVNYLELEDESQKTKAYNMAIGWLDGQVLDETLMSKFKLVWDANELTGNELKYFRVLLWMAGWRPVKDVWGCIYAWTFDDKIVQEDSSFNYWKVSDNLPGRHKAE